ncbi:uncharacterized protein LOC110459408 [Mizuhopecten yessoensis]|uniref:uncharacterized protein LOC110459408 n=1 Tax=Mizuhopecten yessoensis TaxID=6573 RepID=UPI000B4595B4|nr:uncharacterized protein LOC110459408 [Mizuhopecten yessoensis]
MATSLYKAQIPFRIKGQTKCTYHKRRQLDLYCEECQVPVCIKCVSTVHKSHPLCDLSETTPQIKQDVQNFIDKTENVDLSQIDQYITFTEQHLKDNARNFDKLAHQLKTQTNKLKENLDLLIAQTLSVYHQMQEDNTKLLQTYKQDLEIFSTKLKQQLQECKIALQRGSDIQIYDAGSEIQSSVKLPIKPTLGTASFTPNLNPQSHLEQALGRISTSGHFQGQDLLGHDRSIGSSAGQRPSPTQQRSESKGRSQISKGRQKVFSPVYALLSETKMLVEWKPQCVISSVCPSRDGQAWTSDCNSNTLTLLNRKGKVMRKVTHDYSIRDISLSPTTNTLWACDEDNNITELVSGQLLQRFRTSEKPRCICITASNNVIVGMAKQISKFTAKGKLVLSTLAVRTWEPIVCSPRRISECPVTHNIAVVDLQYTDDDGYGNPNVVVMDTDFKKRFVFDGEVPHTYQQTSQSGCEPFGPWSVVYDTVGNLVIGDRGNNRILLISGTGEFLRIIHTDDYWPLIVGVDREDVLWAVVDDYFVKLLQYRSV